MLHCFHMTDNKIVEECCQCHERRTMIREVLGGPSGSFFESMSFKEYIGDTIYCKTKEVQNEHK